MRNICLICLKTENCLLKVVGDDENYQDLEILEKLRNCVPEVKWNLCFKICSYCKDKLYKVYNFRHQCINSYKLWTKSSEYDDLDSKREVETDEIDLDNDAALIEPDLHEDETLYGCFTCGKDFKIKSNLESHIKQKHEIKQDTKVFACEICGKKYATERGVQRHTKSCKIKLKDRRKSTKVKTSENEIIPTTDNVKIDETDLKIAPTCTLCGTTFCNKYLLKRHLQNVHAAEKKFKCDTCNSSFASPVYLNAHKRYHIGDRTHICSFCGKGFITASDLYHHEKIHANKRAYRCEICPKAFNTSSDLHKHKICVHLDRSEWKYVCPYCDRRFPLKTNLDTHVKTHTGEKNYSCHLCDRKCINKSVLTRHIETHSNMVVFKCNLCMQGYKYKKSLDIHMAKIHGIGSVKIPEKIKRFFCHLCPKSYFANNKLQRHIRSHSGEKPFQCSHCEKSFVDKSYIKQHLKIAHNVVSVSKFEI